MKVYKFCFGREDELRIALPLGSVPARVAYTGSAPFQLLCIWYMGAFDIPEEQWEPHTLVYVPTGGEIPKAAHLVGSAESEGGYVAHVFELP